MSRMLDMELKNDQIKVLFRIKCVISGDFRKTSELSLNTVQNCCFKFQYYSVLHGNTLFSQIQKFMIIQRDFSRGGEKAHLNRKTIPFISTFMYGSLNAMVL